MTVPAPDITDAPKRPDSVRLAVELWAVVVLAELISFVAQYPALRDMTQDMVDQMAKDGQDVPASVSSLAIMSMVFVAVILLALTAVAVKFTWDGRNWARQMLGLFSAFLSVQLVFSVIAMFSSTDSGVPAWAMIFEIIGGVAAIGALVSLMHRDTAAYCRDMASWRTRNRQNGGMR